MPMWDFPKSYVVIPLAKLQVTCLTTFYRLDPHSFLKLIIFNILVLYSLLPSYLTKLQIQEMYKNNGLNIVFLHIKEIF